MNRKRCQDPLLVVVASALRRKLGRLGMIEIGKSARLISRASERLRALELLEKIYDVSLVKERP